MEDTHQKLEAVAEIQLEQLGWILSTWCWRSVMGKTPSPVDLKLDPGHWSFYIPPPPHPCNACVVFPQWEPFPGTQPWESEVLLRPSAWYGIHDNPRKASTSALKILVGGHGGLLVFWPPKTSLVYKFPCFLQLPPASPEWLPPSSVSPCPLCMTVYEPTHRAWWEKKKKPKWHINVSFIN